MKKTICDKCEKRFRCNRMDSSRGMACKDFKKKEKNNE